MHHRLLTRAEAWETGPQAFRKEEEMEEVTTSLRKPRIPVEKRQECLDLFEKGNGYKRTATITGLNTYTVRDYRRKYASGDTSWAYGMK